jgi:hypothetical protein
MNFEVQLKIPFDILYIALVCISITILNLEEYKEQNWYIDPLEI